jgi:hypothetical protein
MPAVADTNAMSLHELHESSSWEPEPSTNNNEPSHRHQELDRKRIVALVGSALSQLPIWGMLHNCNPDW